MRVSGTRDRQRQAGVHARPPASEKHRRPPGKTGVDMTCMWLVPEAITDILAPAEFVSWLGSTDASENDLDLVPYVGMHACACVRACRVNGSNGQRTCIAGVLKLW